MSVSNIKDFATREEFRRVEKQITEAATSSQLSEHHSSLRSLSFGDSGHTGFASSVQLTAHTDDATIHFTEANIDHDNITNAADGSHVHIGTSAPAEVAGIWIDTTGGNAAYILKVWNGAAWVTLFEF